MKTEIMKNQPWAVTGGIGAYLRTEYVGYTEKPIDAPKAIPSGSTRENIVTGVHGMEPTRAIIGGLVFIR